MTDTPRPPTRMPVILLVVGWNLALTIWCGIAFPVYSVVYNTQRHDESASHRESIEARQRRDEERIAREEARQQSIADTLRRIEARMGGAR